MARDLDRLINQRKKGRPPKNAELKLIQKLGPLEDLAFKALRDGVKSGDYNFVKLYLEYYIGKPRERVDITTGGESFSTIKVNVVRNEPTTERAPD